MKILHRIVFGLTTANMVSIFLSILTTNPFNFIKWIDSHPYMVGLYYFSFLFNIYVIAFSLYDAFAQHRPPVIKYGFIPLYILAPILSNWKYFEMFIFKQYFFVKKSYGG